MGTMLQAAGLAVGELPEAWNITHPEAVAAIHRRYAQAGSRVLYANTFGANRLKAAGSGYTPAELITAGIHIVKSIPGVKAALDIGPIGQLLEPLGTLTFGEAYDIYREIVVAGEAAGADLIVFETMSDLYEVKAAVLAAKENTSLPVYVTMTYEASGRTFLGTTVSAMGLTLSGLGVDAMGFNCSLGPKELLPMVKELRRCTDAPLILKPNAGLPDPATGKYYVTPEQFAKALAPALELGVSIFGGCCGTTPEFIRALARELAGRQPARREPADLRGVCSATRTTHFGGVRVIGERINPTGKKRFQAALREGNMAYVQELGVRQQDAGADILDVNVGLPGIDEPEMMARVVKALQAVTDLPLQIDSTNPAAIEAGLRAVNGKAIVNSVNGEPEVLRAILPLCKKYGAAVVGLTMDKGGIPQTAEERVAIAKRILDAALAHGIPREDVLIDCLTLTVSAQQDQAAHTLEAVRHVTREMGLYTVLGVSNISFGLPVREHITVNFLIQALHAGLDLPIVNPNQEAVMDAIAAFRVLSGEDRDSEAYIRRFAQAEAKRREGDRQMSEAQVDHKPPVTDVKAARTADSFGEGSGHGPHRLQMAIARGLKEETAALTRQALETMTELDVVNECLIPALDRVGERYERQEIFLPQLISAANAACEGFEVVKARIARRGEGSVSKGKIVLATVEGDIHDIGKNIVKVVLENYGYTVVDLGRDVPAQTVVDAVIREDVKLVGLSALMTTTVASMEKTIAAIRQSGHACKVMVGGAVLTPEYAERIGADYYARDAKHSADIARQVLG